jgi:uncharacterized protein YeaO (DUF488 family)
VCHVLHALGDVASCQESSSEEGVVAVRVVRLGEPREAGEELRIGTVRRPPRGVPKEEFASRDFYDTWLPELSPSQELVNLAHQARSDSDWRAFFGHYRKEMSTPEARHLLDLVVAVSRTTEVAVGCYCEDEVHCHRRELRRLLEEHGAEVR